MKKILLLFLAVLVIYFTCRQISQSVTDTFVDANNNLLDSIRILEPRNEKLRLVIQERTPPPSKQTSELLLQLRTHSVLLDKTMEYMIKNSSGLKDKEIAGQYLINNGVGKQIARQSENFVQKIQQLPDFEGKQTIVKRLSSLYTAPEAAKDGDWIAYFSKGMPVSAVIPYLNRLKLENLRTENWLLNVMDN